MNSSEGAVWLGQVGAHTVRGGSAERVNERRRMRRTERRSIGPLRGTGSSTPVSTAWPLPALRIPNPVITQNTQGLTWVSEPALLPTRLLGTVGEVSAHYSALSAVQRFP